LLSNTKRIQISTNLLFRILFVRGSVEPHSRPARRDRRVCLRHLWGIVGEGYASAGGVDKVLPVDVTIPGCPPRPEAIIFGILVALGRLDARRLHRAG